MSLKHVDLTLQQAQQICKSFNMTFKYDSKTEEYVVYPTGHGRNKDLHYYTNDRVDAVITAFKIFYASLVG